MARQYVGNTRPRTPQELADALSDPQQAARVLGSTPQAMSEFRDAYVRNLLADGSIEGQVREQTQAAMGEFLKANGATGGMPAALGRSAKAAAMYNKAAPGAAVDGVFSSAAELFQSVSWRAQHDRGAQARLAKAAEIQNSFGSEIPADGGFLVPETLRSDLLQVALESSIVRPRAQVIPMSTLRVPIPMIDDTSHASNILGGAVFYWTEEAAPITESQASFGRVVLDAKKLSGFCKVPNELLADGPAFGAWFNRVMPTGLAWWEDLAFLTGLGAGEPLGLISCPAAVSVSAESGQPSATIVWENIAKMYSRMLPGSLRSAVWIANIDTFPQLATMALSVGTGGSAMWIGAGTAQSGADAPPMTILGRPVIFTEKVRLWARPVTSRSWTWAFTWSATARCCSSPAQSTSPTRTI